MATDERRWTQTGKDECVLRDVGVGSDDDNCFIGSCPELFYGGVHGGDPREVFEALQTAIEDATSLYQQDDKPLPKPMTGRDFVNAMQGVA